MLVSFVHSIKMCFIVYWFPHGHLGGGSPFRMKYWVNLACPMHRRATVVSSLLVLLGSSFLSFKIDCTWKILLWGIFSHNCCHFFVIICLIFGLRLVNGIYFILFFLFIYLFIYYFFIFFIYLFIFFKSGTIWRGALANEPALSFPWIPIWLEIQQNITFLLWFMNQVCLEVWQWRDYQVLYFSEIVEQKRSLNEWSTFPCWN